MSGSTSYVVGVRINGDARGLSRAAQEALRQQRLLAGGSIREYQRMAQARAQLGARSEREVQREIAQTQAAYNRLARSGTLSWREQRMAARAMREEVTRLTNEMGRLTARQKLAMGAKIVGALGTAGIGAVAVMKPKLDRAMSFQDRLRDVANVASDVGAGRGDRQREYVAAQEAVTTANRYGGGNRDDALDAYNQMVSKGSTFAGDLPRQLLPEIMKAATASASAANDMASIAAAGIQNFGMKPTAQEAKDWFNIAAIGGKLGGFEVRQQAAYLPEEMALAGNVGMRGKTDFANLIMLNQAAEKTAGTPEKAATNVKQFLTDIGSVYFRKKAEKVTGINFPKYATQNRLQGVGMIDSAMQLVDQQVQKHPAYQQLKTRLAATTDPEQRDKISSAMKIVEGSVSSSFFRNQESAQVVAAYRLHRDFMKAGQKQALSDADEVGAAFDFKQQGAAYQTNRLAIEQAAAMQNTMDKLTPTIGGMSEKLAALMQQYPSYTTAIIAATGALGFLATAAGAAALFGMRGGGGGGGGPILAPTKAGGAKPAGAGGAAAAGGARKLLGKLGTLGMIAGIGYELFGTSDEELRVLQEADRKRKAQGPQPTPAASSYSPTGAQSYTYTAPAGAPPTGYRGAGFDDSRLLTRNDSARPQSLADRLGSGTAAVALPQELKGEILVKVTGAPGLGVQAETKSSQPGVTLRADVGATMTGAGH